MPLCPSPGQLEAFLDRQLSVAEMEAVVTHVEECACCQTYLEDLTKDSTWHAVLEPPTGNARILHAIKQGPPPNGSQTAPCRRDDAGPTTWPALPGYEILSELGRGGMGVVYKARQIRLKRLVALKVVSAWAQTNPEMLARFRREAEAVASLQHPNIVQIHEVGEHQGQPFFCLEYVEGGNLAQRLAGTPQPPRLAAELVATLARAVHYAHQRGIVHRDLKPANVLIQESGIRSQGSGVRSQGSGVRIQGMPTPDSCLLTPDSCAKIGDFGLAKQLDQDVGQTHASAIMGTPSYMAPEQASGNSRDVGPRADVYALGVILYEMLTGRPPFRGATALDTLQLLTTEEPVPVCRLHPKAPRDLETICLKCLRKEPGRRYADAAGLAEDLQRFLSDRPITARPTPAWEHASKWVRRRPTTAALGAGIVVMLVSLLATSLWYNARLETALEDTGKQRDLAKEATALAERRREQTRWNAYVAEINLAHHNWLDGHGGQTLALLERQRPEHVGAIDYRAFEWNYLWRLSHGERRILRGHTDSVLCVAYSPDGRLLASGSTDGTVRIWNGATGREIDSRHGFGAVAWVGFADNQRLLAYALARRLWSWDFGARTVASCESPIGHNAIGFACNVNGRQVATVSSDNSVRIWDNAGPALLQSFTAPVPQRVVFRPDGQRLATAGGDHFLRIWDTATGAKIQSMKGHSSTISAFAFTPNGKILFSVSGDRTIRTWDAVTGRQLSSIPWIATGRAAFSRDCRQLASSLGSNVSFLHFQSGTVRNFGGHSSPVRDLAFRPDGRELATASDDMTVQLWDLDKPSRDLTLRTDTRFNRFTFSPDGKRIATAQMGAVQIWEVATGRLLHAMKDQATHVRDVKFSGDGSRLAVCGSDGTFRVYDAALAAEVSHHRIGVPGTWPGPEMLAFGRNGLVACATSDATLTVFDVDKKQTLHTLKKAGRVLAVHPDGRRVATGDDDGVLRIWDAVTGERLQSVSAHKNGIKNIAYSRDGGRLASVGRDRTVRVWQADTGRLLLTVNDQFNVETVSFSADGKRLATSEELHIRIFDAERGAELLALARLPGLGFQQVEFSPDGDRLAFLTDRVLKVLDATPMPEDTNAPAP